MTKKLYQMAALAFFPMTGAIAQDPPTEIVTEPIRTDGVVMLKGRDLKEPQPGRISFTVDATDITFVRLSLLAAKQIIVDFSGAAKPGQNCIFTSLKHRDYHGSKTAEKTYVMTAAVNPAEVKTIKDLRCLAISRPDPNKFDNF